MRNQEIETVLFFIFLVVSFILLFTALDLDITRPIGDFNNCYDNGNVNMIP